MPRLCTEIDTGGRMSMLVTVVVGVAVLFSLVFAYILANPYFQSRKNALLHKVPLRRKRPLVFDKKIGGLCEFLNYEQLDYGKVLCHLWDGYHHYHMVYFEWQFKPYNTLQACAGAGSAVWEIVYEKNAENEPKENEFARIVAMKNALEKEKTLLQQDLRAEVDDAIDRVVALEKSKSHPAPIGQPYTGGQR